MTMRFGTGSSETEGIRPNTLQNQGGRPAGGRRFKLPKLWKGQRGQAGVNNTSTTDGHHSPGEEEPQRAVPGSLDDSFCCKTRPAVCSPPSVILTFKQNLSAQHFSEASKQLIEREERLFGEVEEAEALKHHEEEVDELAADYTELEDLVLQTVKLSLTPGEVSMEALSSAVKAITQEVDQDNQWRKRGCPPPAWRPRCWKKLHDMTLRSLVERRMDNPSTSLADQVGQSSIRADIHSMGRQLKEDLLLVVEVVKSCYPPELDICNLYARLYHQNLRTRVQNIAEFGLEDKDCTFLLRWVKEYYPEILQKPQLAGEIDAEELGKLLPQELLEPLEEQYLNKRQDELTTYIGRVLEEAKEKWNKGEEPTTEDGCFVSPVAIDIIQFVNGMVTSTEVVVGDRHKAQNITCQLTDLMERFRTFQNDIMKQNKPNSQPFVKANLGCIEQFSDVLRKRSHLFQEDVRNNCLLILPDMREAAHTYLLKPVHEALKPHYRKLGTSDWLKKPLFEELLVRIKGELQGLQGVTESCHQKLTGQLHQEVTAEYVRRLLKGGVKLKDKKQQLKAYETVKDNAESLHDLFVSLGSSEDWLKEILTKIAEVLKLQDLPAIQMQVASLGTAFPDLSEKHVLALLKLKTNLSRADRKTIKETLSEILRENSFDRTRPFFSTVQIK